MDKKSSFSNADKVLTVASGIGLCVELKCKNPTTVVTIHLKQTLYFSQTFLKEN